MKKLVFLSVLLCTYAISQGQITFLKSYGDHPYSDAAKALVQTSDSGFFFAGNSFSISNNNDIYCVRTNKAGDTLWTKKYGGTSSELVNDIILKADTGFVIIGKSNSFDQNGSSDVYVLNLDANGDTLWTTIIAGEDSEEGSAIKATADTGYILTGSYTDADFNILLLVAALDLNGDTLWTRTFQDGFWIEGKDIVQNSAGDYFIGGRGNNDSILLMKMSSTGDSIWAKNYGGAFSDICVKIDTSYDDNLVITGNTSSYGNGQTDFFLFKVNQNGDSLWMKTYGGTGTETVSSFIQLPDSGFLLLGNTKSFGNGGDDIYLVRTDKDGTMIWDTTYGGVLNESNFDIVATSDNGYAICGYSNSETQVDNDAYIFKFGPDFSFPALPATTVTGDTAYCADSSAQLSVVAEADRYIWSNGTEVQTIEVTQPGDYSAIIENFMGIRGYSDTITITEIPLPVVELVSNKGSLICKNGQAYLIPQIANDNGKEYGFSWSTGGNEDSLLVSSADKYFVTATDFYGCEAEDSLEITLTELPTAPDVCMVTYDDATGKFKVIWNEVPGDNLDQYKVYNAQLFAQDFTGIGQVAHGGATNLIDPGTNPTADYYKYKVASIDTCGNESPLDSTDYHQPMRLVATLGTESINLSWQSYYIEDGSFVLSDLKILSGQDSTNLELLADLDPLETSYIDTTTLGSSTRMFYQLVGTSPYSCDPGKKLTSLIKSPIVNNGLTTALRQNETGDFMAFPNPAGSNLNLSYSLLQPSNVQINAYSITGQLVLSSDLGKQDVGKHLENISLTGLESGIYLVEIKTNRSCLKKTVIKK